MTFDSNSVHYRFAAHIGAEFSSAESRPYGGIAVEIPVAVVQQQELDNISGGPVLDIGETEYAHLRMFALGAYQPLTGFMGTDEMYSVIQSGCLQDFLPWEEPICLGTEHRFPVGSRLLLSYEQVPIARITIRSLEEIPADLDQHKFDVAGRYIIGGDLVLLLHPGAALTGALADWNELLDPPRTRDVTCNRTAVAGVELWRADDEYLVQAALEMSDQVILHPSGKRAVSQDEALPETLTLQANSMAIRNLYPSGNVVAGPYPQCLAGCQLSLIHLAIVYQNLGCRRLVVVSDERLERPAELSAFNIDVIHMSPAFHCANCGGHVTSKLCTHAEDARSRLTEAEILGKLVLGEQLPPSVARPEVARMLSRNLSNHDSVSAKAKNRRHIFPHASQLTRSTRHQLNGHRSAVLWMTGLSGSGKSTIATGLEKELVLSGHQVCVLDGDTLRNGLCSDLGFSPGERRENLRRAAEIAKLMMENGMLVLASFISPFIGEREMLRQIIGKGYHEVFVQASLEDCERRDPKGLYQRARSGLIPEFTGISSPYEEPSDPEFRVNTSMLSIKEAIRQMMFELGDSGFLRNSQASSTASAPEAGASSLMIETLRRN